MSEDRIAALEEHVAHQALALEQLDEVVRGQWAEIERLRREIERLTERLESMGEDGVEDRPPPHY